MSAKNLAVFERHEKKYQLDAARKEQFLSALLAHMTPDEYGVHTICSLYCDTEDYRIIRASREKPAYKEKLRLRSYGVPDEDSKVFLELKKKVDGVVYKRRISLCHWEAEEYLSHGVEPASLESFRQRQIFAEIDWFCRRHQPEGRILIACDRLALYGKEDPSLRVTFDFNIRWRGCDLSLTQGDYGAPLLPAGDSLMEIKTGHAMPLWLTELLTRFSLYPQSFSKVGTAYLHLMLGHGLPVAQRGGLRHAG